MSQNISRQSYHFILFLLLIVSFCVSENALAGGDAVAMITKGVSRAQTVVYTVLGAGSAVYLLIKGFMLKINKIGWNDLLVALVTTGVVAGLPALATWFWDIGGNKLN